MITVIRICRKCRAAGPWRYGSLNSPLYSCVSFTLAAPPSRESLIDRCGGPHVGLQNDLIAPATQPRVNRPNGSIPERSLAK